MDHLDTWWDFDSGLSLESSEEDNGEVTAIPLFLGLEQNPNNVRYVPIEFEAPPADMGMVLMWTISVMSIILVVLAVMAIVLYSKLLLRRRTATIDLANDVYQSTIEGEVPLQKNQLPAFHSFPEKEEPLLRMLEIV